MENTENIAGILKQTIVKYDYHRMKFGNYLTRPGNPEINLF